MYAVREGHVEVVQLLLEYELLDVLATNAVSILIYSYRSLDITRTPIISCLTERPDCAPHRRQPQSS